LSFICKSGAKVLKIFEISPNAVQNYYIDAQSFCVTVKKLTKGVKKVSQ